VSASQNLSRQNTLQTDNKNSTFNFQKALNNENLSKNRAER
jgi:hypothetical protein